MTLLLPVTLLAHDFEGTVKMAGPVPIAPLIPVGEKHIASCGKEQESPGLIVGGGGVLQNAVVSLQPLSTPQVDNRSSTYEVDTVPVLDQKNCRFSPHILIIPAGRPFRVTNQDPMDHDVRAFTGGDMLFRFEMLPFGKEVEQKFETPGTYVVRCGLHKWMHAFVVAAEHPYYAVTGPDGRFKVPGLPEGKYRLRVWHETLGEHEEPVEISGSVGDFSYEFPKENGA